jgi:hypothetical protein
MSPEIWPFDKLQLEKYISSVSLMLGFDIRLTQRLSDKEASFYHDFQFCRYIKKAFRGGIVIGMPTTHQFNHRHIQWSRPNLLGMVQFSRFSQLPQACTSWIMLANSPRTRDLVDCWLALNLKSDLASHCVEPSEKGQVPDFIENRGDQSILHLLMLSRNIGSYESRTMCKNAFIGYHGNLLCEWKFRQ